MSDESTPPTTTPSTIRKVPKLKDLSQSDIGNLVKLHGWVYSTRVQGAGTLFFMDLGDGTTVTPIRCLAQKEAASTDTTPIIYGSSTAETPDVLTNADEREHYTPMATFDDLTQTTNLCTGCSVMVLGYVDSPPQGTSQTFEVKLLKVYLIGAVPDASKYPIQKSILKKPLALRGLYHERFRAPLVQQVMLIRSQALFGVHEFFHNEGVPLLDPNIMTSNDCEGAGEVFKIGPQMFTKLPDPVEESKKNKKNKKNKNKNNNNNPNNPNNPNNKGKPQTEGADATEATDINETAAALSLSEQPPTPTPPIAAAPEVGLTVSSQLPLEAIAMGTGSVYTCQKSFRAEKSDTNKHLAEFLHVEYEQYFLTLDELMDQAERFVKHVVTTTLERCRDQYGFLNQKHAAPVEFHGHADYLAEIIQLPFVRITHADAVAAMLADVRNKVQVTNEAGKMVRLKFKQLPKAGEDLASEHEKYLVQKFGTFTFVTHWPSAIKSFYMKQVGDDTCESFDLLAPLVGELFGGSMREWRYDVLMEQMAKKQMDVGALQWFVDLRRNGGTAPHGGWGMGFDRLVMFLTNSASVRDVVPYPVYYGHCPY